MHKMSFSTKLARRRLTKESRCVLMIGLVFASTLVFAGTPVWLKDAARAPLPTYPDDTDAVVLLDDTFTTVSPAGEVRTTYRKAYKILRPAGHTRGILSVYFDNETQLTFLKGWSITPQDGDFEVKEGDAIEMAAFSESLYADTRYKVLRIPAARPGSVIGYEYQQKQRPFVMQAIWAFQDEIPVRRARFALELPSTWSYTAYWRNRTAAIPQQSRENRWTWELADVEPIRSEPEMPDRRSVAGQLGVSFAPKESVSSWAQIGRWYAQLTADRRAITPAIRDKTREIIAGVSDPMGRIRLLASYVQHDIRYVAIEIGIGGYQPHFSEDIMTGGYGDCKDKATLLNTMLREAGVDSYYVLINADRDYLAPDFPSPLHFNHVILAIRLPRGGDMPKAFAILQDQNLGPLLLFDPTDSSTPFGYLPPSLQSNHGLLVTDAEGELVKLPLQPPSANRLLRVATLKLDKSGNLKGTVEEVRTGPSATALRERLLNLPRRQRQKVFQDMLSDLVDGAVLTSAAVSDLKAFDGSISLEYELTVEAYAQRAGDLFLFRSCMLGRKTRDFLEGKPRTEPVVFSHTASESDVIDISFPSEYVVDEIPHARNYDLPFAMYKSASKVAEHSLHYTRTYELKDVRVQIEQLGDLRKFFREVADDEQGYTILKSQ
jgi:hypothetical protein